MLREIRAKEKIYAARYEELIDLVEAEELEVTEKEEAAVDAKTVVAESAAGEQKAMTQIEEEPAMMNPTILEEVQMEIPATTGKIICPVCGGELVLRTARRGANTGKQFYGCSSFPRCRYILNIAENLENQIPVIRRSKKIYRTELKRKRKVKNMELMELLKLRRTYRRFKQEPISDEIIDEMLTAARYASSAANLQPITYVVVKSQRR
mgnify:CR=1 FL=1